MKIRLSELRQLIREELEIYPDAEAPPDAPLGQIAFSRERYDVTNTEKNTKVENDLFIDIVQHLEDNSPISMEDTKFMLSFIEKGQYKKIFRRPRVAKVYRGMRVSEKWVKDVLRMSPEDQLADSGEEDVSFIFSSRAAVSSWTRSQSQAERFSRSELENVQEDYTVVLTADAQDPSNSFIDMVGFYMLMGLEDFKDEKEVIGVGKIKVSNISFKKFNPEEDHDADVF